MPVSSGIDAVLAIGASLVDGDVDDEVHGKADKNMMGRNSLFNCKLGLSSAMSSWARGFERRKGTNGVSHQALLELPLQKARILPVRYRHTLRMFV